MNNPNAPAPAGRRREVRVAPHLESRVPTPQRVAVRDWPSRLRAVRADLNVRQARMAELLHVAPRTYERWEQGIAEPALEGPLELALRHLIDLRDSQSAAEARINPEILG